jgi:DegV family protein with EDD domain
VVKVVTDSTSDIPPEVAQELGITVVPLFVHFDTEEVYRDRVNLSMEEFYQKLVSGKTFPTTAAPSPGAFAEAFDKLAEETDEILTIVISSKYSATYDAALNGVEQRKRKQCRVEVIDSLNTLMGLGLLVIAVAKEAKAGQNLDELTDIVRKSMPKAHARFTMDTLEYLRRGGRVGTAKAFLSTLLGFKPIIEVKDGYTSGIGRVRSRAKAMEHLIDFAKSFPRIKELAVGYTTTPEDASMLAQRLDPIFPKERIYISIIGSVTGAHVGPGGLEVAVLEE